MRNFWTGLIVFGIILLSFWVQINLMNRIPLFGVKANMGIVFIVAISTLCGQGVGISIGLVYGVLSDIFFGKAFGIYTLLFLGIGFFCGHMSKRFSKENKSALVMVTSLATLVFEVFCYGFFFLIYRYEILFWQLLKTIGLEMLYNMFLARILFQLFSGLAEIINKGKRSYYLL